jgi:hypothetical protein
MAIRHELQPQESSMTTTAAITPLPPSFNSKQINLAPDGATVMVASLKLTAGNWIVYGKFQVVNENFVIANTYCRLTSSLNISQGNTAPSAQVGSPIDYSELNVTAVPDQPTDLNVSLMGPCVVGAGGGYAIITARPLALPAPTAIAIQLVAIKVDNFVS